MTFQFSRDDIEYDDVWNIYGTPIYGFRKHQNTLIYALIVMTINNDNDNNNNDNNGDL